MLKGIFDRNGDVPSRDPSKKNGRFAPQHLIDIHEVVKAYVTPVGDFIALDSADLQVDDGEFAAVVGKSGSGKSTLIYMITGIDKPTSGLVYVGDTYPYTL